MTQDCPRLGRVYFSTCKVNRETIKAGSCVLIPVDRKKKDVVYVVSIFQATKSFHGQWVSGAKAEELVDMNLQKRGYAYLEVQNVQTSTINKALHGRRPDNDYDEPPMLLTEETVLRNWSVKVVDDYILERRPHSKWPDSLHAYRVQCVSKLYEGLNFGGIPDGKQRQDESRSLSVWYVFDKR